MSNSSPLAVRRRWNQRPVPRGHAPTFRLQAERRPAGRGGSGLAQGSIASPLPARTAGWGPARPALPAALGVRNREGAAQQPQPHQLPQQRHRATLRQEPGGCSPPPSDPPAGDRSPGSRRFGSWCVEVQTARAPRPCAAGRTTGHHIQAKRLDAGGIVPKRLQAQADPARNLGAAGVRKPHQLRELEMGMMPGTTGVSAQAVRLHKAEIRIAVVRNTG